MGLVSEGAMDVYYLVAGQDLTTRKPIASGPPTTAPRNQGSPAPRQTSSSGDSLARQDFGPNPGLIDKSIQAIRSGNDTELLAACFALTDNYRDASKAEVIPLLEGLLTNPRIPVRRHAAKALGTWGTQQSVPKLEALATDRSGLVQSAAAEAIRKIKQRKS
jgi:HEAT repeat protein